MPNIARAIMFLGVGAASLFGGVEAGPLLRNAYLRTFPPPAYRSGDFSALFAQYRVPVVAFTTTTCPYCRQARAFFEREHVVYQDLLIDESDEAKRAYASLHAEGVPVVLVGDRLIEGFREDALHDALIAASVPRADARAPDIVRPASSEGSGSGIPQ